MLHTSKLISLFSVYNASVTLRLLSVEMWREHGTYSSSRVHYITHRSTLIRRTESLTHINNHLAFVRTFLTY